MLRQVLLISMVMIVCFASCSKKKGPTTACFTFSKEKPKVNDTLYLLNCSENYNKFIWFNGNGFFPTGNIYDSVSRHQRIVVTSAGPYAVTLRVGDYNFYWGTVGGSTDITKTITVEP